MTKLFKSTLILIFIIFTSCEKKISEVDFEKRVMLEILPNLIDSTCIDRRIMLNFPPKYGQSIYDKTGHYIGIDSTKATEEEKQNILEWKKRNFEIENDTSKIIIGFDPIIKFSKENFEEDFKKHFDGSVIFKSSKETNKEFKLDLKKIVLNNKFKLKNINEFPGRDKIWDTKYNFNFSGVVYFSRIQFDEDKKLGILNGGFWCGHKCGQGFTIYIKKTNSKWIIDKVEGTWVS